MTCGKYLGHDPDHHPLRFAIGSLGISRLSGIPPAQRMAAKESDGDERGDSVLTGVKVQLKGYRLDKSGKLVRDVRRLDVSARLRQKASKRVRVKRRTAS